MNIYRAIIVLLASFVIFNSISPSVGDGPKRQPDQIVTLKAELKMINSSLKAKNEQIARLKKQIAEYIEKTTELQQKISKLEALCRKNGLDFQTPAEKAETQKKADKQFQALYEKHRKHYVYMYGKFTKLPPLNPVGVHRGLNFNVGQVFIIEAATVRQVLGGKSMLIWKLGLKRSYKKEKEKEPPYYWQEDKYKTLLVTGYPTKNLADDQDLWYGGKESLLIALVSTRRIGTFTFFNAVPYAQVSKGLSKQQFIKMLKMGIGPKEALEGMRRLDQAAHPVGR